MDLTGAIRSLRAEVEKIDRIIAALQTLAPAASVAEAIEAAAPAPPPRKRGRKSMNPEERQEVAERMRRYWAQRRGHPEKTA